MNFDKLNQWLSLFANIGVLVGIVIVAFELQQTRTEMRAEAGSTRSEMAIRISESSGVYGISEIRTKVRNGQELTDKEQNNARIFNMNMLRYLENLHLQHEIGVLDDEIWQANLNSINAMCRDDLFLLAWGNWREHPSSDSFRQSFVNLVMSPCEE